LVQTGNRKKWLTNLVKYFGVRFWERHGFLEDLPDSLEALAFGPIVEVASHINLFGMVRPGIQIRETTVSDKLVTERCDYPWSRCRGRGKLSTGKKRVRAGALGPASGCGKREDGVTDHLKVKLPMVTGIARRIFFGYFLLVM
jgi:hypothetical protein